MVSDKIYDMCRPVLEDGELGEEEKTDRLEELLSSAPTSLKGKALEDAVLGALWQWKSATDSKSSAPPVRGVTIARSMSPAPWLQRAGTPTSSVGSPRPSSAAPGLGPLSRTKSSTASPFSSPRPSPRLPVATPAIPHSPRLSAYQFSDSSPTTENYGDYGSDTVDWLVNDNDGASSNTSTSDYQFISPYTTEMSPYDMLRSILQDSRSDEELEHLLEANGYDLGQTVNSIMEVQGMGMNYPLGALQQQQQQQDTRSTYLVGKSLSSSRPVTPNQKSSIPCRYWIASGHCARADCRFAHEVENSHVCKYWMQGNCLAGSSCLFSHDPASVLMQQLTLAGSGANTPQQQAPNFQLQDYDSFPALQRTTSNPYEDSTAVGVVDPNLLASALAVSTNQHSAGGLFRSSFTPTGPRLSSSGSRPNSRPSSRHTSHSRASTPQPPGANFQVQDDEAFPALGSKPTGKRHHGKRGGHGHGQAQYSSNSMPVQANHLAVGGVSSSALGEKPTASTRDALRRGLRNGNAFTSSSNSIPTTVPAPAIPTPQNIPWLATGPDANPAYLKARQEAFKHGGMRNKFLQSAAQAWNRNDARGAKALSLRGQNENERMRGAWREAADALWSAKADGEVWCDLHGLGSEEAEEYLSACLKEQASARRGPHGGVVYAICGTGQGGGGGGKSSGGKDKVGKAVRFWLGEAGFVWREFSVPGERGGMGSGGILGVEVGREKGDFPGGGDADSGIALLERDRDGAVKVLAEDLTSKVGTGVVGQMRVEVGRQEGKG